MKEKFSQLEAADSKIKKYDIKEGYNDWLFSRSKCNRFDELVDGFEKLEAERPLTRQELATEAENFGRENFEDFLVAFCQDERVSGENISKQLIKKFDLTNQDLAYLGCSETIDESGYVAHGGGVGMIAKVFSLIYAKKNLRLDTAGEMGKWAGTKLPHRYYLASQGRYLCANDFGIKTWSEEEGRQVEGDVTKIDNFISRIGIEFERIAKNIRTVHANGLSSATERSGRYSGGSTVEDFRGGKFSDDAELTSILEETEKKAAEEWITRAGIYVARADAGRTRTLQDEGYKWHLQSALQTACYDYYKGKYDASFQKKYSENSKDRELLLSGINAGKVSNHLHFHYEKISRKFHLETDDPIADYERAKESGLPELEGLFLEPDEEEKEGCTIPYAYSEYYKQPIVPADQISKQYFLKLARSGVMDVLASRAAAVDPELKGDNCYKFRGTAEGYEFAKILGVEKAKLVAAPDGRDFIGQSRGMRYLIAMKYDFSRLTPEEIKKQLREVENLERSGVFDYLQRRDKEIYPEENPDQLQGEEWFSILNPRDSRSLFREGKRMYWLAKQVFMRAPNRKPEDRFYKLDQEVDWAQYELSDANISEQDIQNLFSGPQKNLLFTLLAFGNRNQQNENNAQNKTVGATLGLIVEALNLGRDIRGVGLARDKKRYLKGVIDNVATNDLEFSLEDWPAEWKQAVSKEEIDLYYENASAYVLLDPDGLTRYAAWKSSKEGKRFEAIFAEAPSKKSELDFRICIADQGAEVLEWYLQAAEHVGNSVMQKYLMKFNATRRSDGRLAKWHDVLLWSPNIKKVEPKEAVAILSNIETVDENNELTQFLPRYVQAKDSHKNKQILSLRELKKRVFAIESNIDLSKFPPEVIDITSAPGFNLSSLESISKRPDFKDLVEGRLDKEQPFEPRTRMFAARDLSEALSEGLGSQKNSITGTAATDKGGPKALFRELDQMIQGRKIGEKKMTVSDLLKAVPVNLEERVIELLRAYRIDVGAVVEANVHAKSDPEGWVCGNYTDCCMPFGDDKNTDYMFNKSTQYFTIKYNGRIVAQSVIVDSADRRNASDVVVLDNIEVAPNYQNLTPLLSRVYQTFWTEYTSLPVKVGTGYSDLTPPGAKLEPNNFKPKTSISYSDAQGSRIYDLPKMKGVEPVSEMLITSNITARDAELVSDMEKVIYQGDMVFGKEHVAELLEKQRELDVPGAAASFIIRKGKDPAGYVLVLPDQSKVNPGESVAYIHDIAVLPKFRGADITRKMMERVMDGATAYGVAIEADARASTSYALLMNPRIRRWFESKGFYLTRNEKDPSSSMNGEDFYFVRFENRNQVEQEAV